MRKRILIGGIAVILIGIAAYMLSQPKKGTVQWHKAKYMECVNRMWGTTLWGRVQRYAKQTVGIAAPEIPDRRAQTEARSHLSALVDLGYLSERRYVITNTSLNDVLARTYQQRRIFGRTYLPPDLTERVEGADRLVVTALPDLALQYDDLIRQADAPPVK